RALADAARVHLDAAVMADALERGDTHLYHAVHLLGINPKFGGLRGYSANLRAEDPPLDRAIIGLYRAAGRTTSPMTFNMELPYPKIEEQLAEAAAVIPAGVSPILGRLVTNVIEAHYWAELAFRNVDGTKRATVARRFDIGSEQVDAYDYCPAFDDVARTWDEASLWYAGEKCVQALDDARIALAAVKDIPAFAFDWQTPWGWIRVRGSGDDNVDGADALLIVDLGGNDQYTGGIAASDASRSISLLLDVGGDDRYESGGPAQGAGLCGIGILIDAAGRDVYRADRYAQGVGQFGLGVCADLGGDDDYFVKYSGQGCGYFGVGLMLDSAGTDRYRLYADGQGLGGVAGVGVLADRAGDDFYEAVRDSTITGRPSYHSEGENISVNNAQGCAMGRRGDGADGHSWAGGLGALLDASGNDKYVSGNWSMGTGYWFGMGLLHDGGGNHEYGGVAWSQATGAHFCIGVLVDEGGDDKHLVEATSSNSLAFAHDFTAALLINIGGNDRYEAAKSGIGYSINRSVAALIDVGGDDVYVGVEGDRPGMAIFDEKFRARGGVSDYFADTTSVGLFLDVGGQDTYWSGQQNDTHWLDEADSPNLTERNFSIGVDRPDGTVSFRPIPQKMPTGEPAKQR
ncbi:MAG: hypothetical protein GY778_06240, partial [bacterium]|nr:hypothetical protein [bacterium]